MLRDVLRSTPTALTLALAAFACANDEVAQRNWPQWRGPTANGVAPQGDPPITWSAAENFRWKKPIDGLGNSTPIVWNDRVILLTAVDTGQVDASLPAPAQQPDRPFGIKYPNTFHQYVVLCLDRRTGQEIWRQVAAELVPNEGHHGDNSFATASPATDGERLYVWFGSGGLFCYDLGGELLWSMDLGEAQTRLSFGEGASPVVHGNRVIIVRDHEGQSFIDVVDAATGDRIWRQNREEPSTWATPLVVERDGITQVITNGQNRVRSYDLEGGELIWECGGQVSNVTPTPVASSNFVFCMSGYRGSSLLALPLNAQGDITGTTQVAWTKSRGTPYVPSPLLLGNRLYYTQSNSGILSCADATSGELLIDRKRMPGIRVMYASPVAAADRVYFTGRDGTTLVIENGDKFKQLALNELGEPVDASPAISGNEIFIRGKSHLYCLTR